jgi:hypothetical protein
MATDAGKTRAASSITITAGWAGRPGRQRSCRVMRRGPGRSRGRGRGRDHQASSHSCHRQPESDGSYGSRRATDKTHAKPLLSRKVAHEKLLSYRCLMDLHPGLPQIVNLIPFLWNAEYRDIHHRQSTRYVNSGDRIAHVVSQPRHGRLSISCSRPETDGAGEAWTSKRVSYSGQLLA